MFSKPNLISTLLTSIWAYFGGYLLWDVIGGPLLQNHKGSAQYVEKSQPDMVLMVLACIITGFAFSTIYGKWARGKHGALHGLKYGLLISLFGISYALISFSMTKLMELTGAIYDAALSVVYYLIMGALAGMAYNAFQKPATH